MVDALWQLLFGSHVLDFNDPCGLEPAIGANPKTGVETRESLVCPD